MINEFSVKIIKPCGNFKKGFISKVFCTDVEKLEETFNKKNDNSEADEINFLDKDDENFKESKKVKSESTQNVIVWFLLADSKKRFKWVDSTHCRFHGDNS